jgi:putative transposase
MAQTLCPLISAEDRWRLATIIGDRNRPQKCRPAAGYRLGMMPPTPPSYAGHRFPPEVIGHAAWLYFRFPLGLRMVEEMLAARGIVVSHETVRQWALKFGQAFADQIRRRLSRAGDKWHLDEVVITIAGERHWLRQAVDQDGTVLDVPVQRRRDKRAAKRLLRKLLKRQGRAPRVVVTDKLASYSWEPLAPDARLRRAE